MLETHTHALVVLLRVSVKWAYILKTLHNPSWINGMDERNGAATVKSNATGRLISVFCIIITWFCLCAIVYVSSFRFNNVGLLCEHKVGVIWHLVWISVAHLSWVTQCVINFPHTQKGHFYAVGFLVLVGRIMASNKQMWCGVSACNRGHIHRWFVYSLALQHSVW